MDYFWLFDKLLILFLFIRKYSILENTKIPLEIGVSFFVIRQQ